MEKVVPLHVLNNKEVDRYFRIFLSISTYGDNIDDHIKSMSSDQLGAVITLGSFSIDIGEDVYETFFGEFDEMEFERDQQD